MYLLYVDRSHSLAERERAVALFYQWLNRQTRMQRPEQSPTPCHSRYDWPCVLLETCDRFELYCDEQHFPAIQATIQQSTAQQLPASGEKAANWRTASGTDALRHLFRVVCGLDSPLFGEKAIQGQVKLAYLNAAENFSLSAELHCSFQNALSVGKRVRRETALDCGAMSHVRTTWEILQQILAEGRLDPENLAICLIGVNQLNEDLVELLRRKGFHKFFLANRNFAKAEQASREWGGQAFHFDHLAEVVQRCQVVISATRAPHYILHPEQVVQRQQPLYIFDLAVPRDADPALKNMPHIRLWNVEDIEGQIAANFAQRKAKAEWAEQIIDEELTKYYERKSVTA